MAPFLPFPVLLTVVGCQAQWKASSDALDPVQTINYLLQLQLGIGPSCFPSVWAK